jgi:ABC-type Fe3+-hydroxamate transport system substrate-binding protein
VTLFRRRGALAALIALLALAASFIVAGPAWARTVTDSAGRQVEIPDHVSRVFAAGAADPALRRGPDGRAHDGAAAPS